jgi:poly(3-hydroxybutyrate) depolymerase
MPSDGKLQSHHIDNIEEAENDSLSGQNTHPEYADRDGSADDVDEIVQNLAQAGEEVGMTWRSILAAGVSSGLSFAWRPIPP